MGVETLAALEPVFGRRPFVLGERPSEADFGFFASAVESRRQLVARVSQSVDSGHSSPGAGVGAR